MRNYNCLACALNYLSINCNNNSTVLPISCCSVDEWCSLRALEMLTIVERRTSRASRIIMTNLFFFYFCSLTKPSQFELSYIFAGMSYAPNWEYFGKILSTFILWNRNRMDYLQSAHFGVAVSWAFNDWKQSTPCRYLFKDYLLILNSPTKRK